MIPKHRTVMSLILVLTAVLSLIGCTSNGRPSLSALPRAIFWATVPAGTAFYWGPDAKDSCGTPSDVDAVNVAFYRQQGDFSGFSEFDITKGLPPHPPQQGSCNLNQNDGDALTWVLTAKLVGMTTQQ